MASVSYQLQPGTEAEASGSGFYADNVTVGTAAPTTAGDVELRIDLANTPTREQVVQVLVAFIRRIQDQRYGPADFGNI